MRKYLGLTSLVLFTLIVVSFAPDKKQKQKHTGFKGHVQWVIQIPYYAKDSNGVILKGNIISDTDYKPEMKGPQRKEDNSGLYESTAYDNNGDITEQCKYHADGKLYLKETCEYYPNGDRKQITDSFFAPGNHFSEARIRKFTEHFDNNGKLIDSAEFDFSNQPNPVSIKKDKYVYAPSGKMIEILYFIDDTLNPQYLDLLRYNEKGKRTETDRSARDANRTQGDNNIDLVPSEKYVYAYDERGRQIDNSTYNVRQGLVKEEKTTFDSAGKTVELFSYGMNKTLTGTVVKRTINESHTLQEDTYDGDGLLTDYTISHFDSAKHLLDRGVFRITYQKVLGEDRKYHNREPGDTVMVRHLVNDDHFNTIEDDNFSNDGKPKAQKTYQYTYDSAGNWIVKIHFNNGAATRLEERQIIYYKD